MSWPTCTDYSEVIQNSAFCFSDAELRQGTPDLHPALGVPLLWSGNFASVYRVPCPHTGNTWAVKCFTREIPNLADRYRKISTHLQQAHLPFTTDFAYLERGIRVRRKWYPILKMRWVDGCRLNEFVEQHLDKPQVLGALLRIWIRVAQCLREKHVVHGDLQHGNVLMVPVPHSDRLGLTLVDYDGMFVPALHGQESGEVGHPNYQHPERSRHGGHNLAADQFSHLVICCAIQCLVAGGRTLWERYDNSDNLLFREADFQDPCTSPLFQELWARSRLATRALIGHLILASQTPLDQAPPLDEVMVDDQVRVLTSAQEERVDSLLARAGRQLRTLPRALAAAPCPEAFQGAQQPWWQSGAAASSADTTAPAPLWAFDDCTPQTTTRRALGPVRRSPSPQLRQQLRILAGMLVAVGVLNLVGMLFCCLPSPLRSPWSELGRVLGSIVLLALPGGIAMASAMSIWRLRNRRLAAAGMVATTGAMLAAGGMVSWAAWCGLFFVAPLCAWGLVLLQDRDVQRLFAASRVSWSGSDVFLATAPAIIAAGLALLPIAIALVRSQASHEIVNCLGMKLAYIPAGEFLMGSPESDSEALDSEKPQQRVRIAHPYYLGVFEVTQSEYERLTGKNPSKFTASGLPVEGVTWQDAEDFCDALSAQPEERAAGRRYRLPTEAEWEYACRAGSNSRYGFGDEDQPLGDYAWFEKNSDGQTHAVGGKKPNAWGLFDMLGNVWEWCGEGSESFDLSYHSPSAAADAKGGPSGRVFRGGCLSSNASVCRCAVRNMSSSPALRIGFRVVAVTEPASPAFQPPGPQVEPLPPGPRPVESPPGVDETGIGSVGALFSDASRAATAAGHDAQKPVAALEPAANMAADLPATMPECPQPKLAIPSQPNGSGDLTSQPSPRPPQPIDQASKSKPRNEERKQAMFAAVREISLRLVRYDKKPANKINAITDEIMERAVRHAGLEIVRTARAELEVTLSVRGETEAVQPAPSSERNPVLLSISAHLQDLQDGETVTVWEAQQDLGQVMPNESDPQKLRQIREALGEFFRQFASDYREARSAQAGNAPKAAASPTSVNDRPESPLP